MSQHRGTWDRWSCVVRFLDLKILSYWATEGFGAPDFLQKKFLEGVLSEDEAFWNIKVEKDVEAWKRTSKKNIQHMPI